MAISVVGVGAVDSATPWAPSIAGPVLADDIILILVEQASLTTPEAAPAATGFAHVLGSPVGPDSAGTVLSVLWKRAVGGETSATVTGPSNHAVTRTITLRGVKATGNPWNVNPAVVTDAAASTTATWPAVTPTAADCLILLCIATGRDNNSTANLGAVTNANLTSLTERVDNWVATGTGGGIGLVTGFKAAATTTGTSTATMGTTDGKALMTLPLEPAAATGATATPAIIATTVAVPAVTVQTGATVEPATIAATAALPAATVSTGGRTAPTYPDAKDLVEGTGTRAFAAVTTSAGDWLVVEVELERDGGGSTAVASGGGLTYTPQNDTGAGSDADARIHQITAPDAAGGSRTVTITPGDAGINYRARLTVVRGSDGPGTGKGTSKTAQTVSVTRQNDNSGMFMAAADFSTGGTIGTPTWTPGGTTVAAQDGTAADYAFGRWNDSGAAGTASHGVSTPTLTTPVIAVLEMLGTGATGDATAAPATIAATATLPATAVNIAAAPAVTATTAAVPAAAVSTAAAPAAIATTAALPAAAVHTAAAPGVLAAVVALPQATASGGEVPATVTPATIAATVATPAAAVGAAAAPATVAATTALPDLDVAVGASPATVAAVVALPAPIVDTGGGNATAGPAVIAATAALPGPALTVGAAPATVQAVVALPAPTVGSATTATPDTIPTAVTFPAAVLAVGAVPATIQLVVTIPRPTAGSGLAVASSTAAVTAAVTSTAPVTAGRTSTATVSGG